eukprot:TRINITY_DN7826_c0_g1_i1.p1 TRINITY_DN7826_c0_g1~~TRINITY_DN7826_c0_g1_i1.p1  ORF type:complete len:1090 (-),score=130.01 TRINITY_DN7826_c0_g1_i1:1428-4697(-)
MPHKRKREDDVSPRRSKRRARAAAGSSTPVAAEATGAGRKHAEPSSEAGSNGVAEDLHDSPMNTETVESGGCQEHSGTSNGTSCALDDSSGHLQSMATEDGSSGEESTLKDSGSESDIACEEEWYMSGDSHEALPHEIWVYIFESLPDADRWALAKTSSRFFYIFKNSVGFSEVRLHKHAWRAFICDYVDSSKDIPVLDFTTVEDPRSVYGSTSLYIFDDENYKDVPDSVHEEQSCAKSALKRLPEEYQKRRCIACVLVPGGREGFMSKLFSSRLTERLSALRVELSLLKGRHVCASVWVNAKLLFTELSSTFDTLSDDDHSVVSGAVEELIRKDMLHTTTGLFWNACTMSDRGEAKQPPSLLAPLKDFQLKCLQWMVTIELAAHEFGTEYDLFLTPRGCESEVGLSFQALSQGESRPKDRRLRVHHSYCRDVSLELSKLCHKSEAKTARFSFRGGVLADQMGMGKTMTCIALMLANPRQEIAGALSAPVRRMPCALETKGTLVLCPSQIVVQWKNELNTHCPSLNVIMLRGARDIQKHKEEVHLADVVVMSHKLFQNRKLGGSMDSSLEDPARLIGWHRIIIDEAHELLASRILNKKAMYQSNYRWYVSGTPFPSGRESLLRALDFLCEFSPDVPMVSKVDTKMGDGRWQILQAMPTFAEYKAFQLLHERLYWRCTKAVTKDVVKLPQIEEHVEFVEFSPIERDLYECARLGGWKSEQRQIATDVYDSLLFYLCQRFDYPGLEEARPLPELDSSEFRVSAIMYFKDARRSLEQAVQSSKARLAEMSRRSAENIDSAKRTLKMRQRALEIAGQQIEVLERNYRRPTGYEDEHENGDDDGQEEWGDELSRVERAYLEGQIIYSNHHTSQMFPGGSSRPTLRYGDERIRKSDRDSRKSIEINGAKMRSLLTVVTRILDEDPDSKIIVFSKFDATVHKLRTKLNQGAFGGGIVVSCRGNHHVRRKAIDRFNAKGPGSARVILLSLTHSASGTHLVSASHIVLVDPVTGTKDEAQAQDAQAIARAHRIGQDKPVKVSRLIVANTIDQEDYESAYGKCEGSTSAAPAAGGSTSSALPGATSGSPVSCDDSSESD